MRLKFLAWLTWEQRAVPEVEIVSLKGCNECVHRAEVSIWTMAKKKRL